jgi:hypothetical protein
MSDLEAFLAGEGLADVAFFLHEDAVSAPEALAEYATPVENGLVIVVAGERGRDAFRAATGVDPMALATEARDREGTVAGDLAGGTCPEDDDGADHEPRFVFAFAEAQNEEVGGLYAAGDVMHAYASCSCGTPYADTWVIGEREGEDYPT